MPTGWGGRRFFWEGGRGRCPAVLCLVGVFFWGGGGWGIGVVF